MNAGDLVLQPPSLVLLLSCASLFVYQALDAIDGKQARRVNHATPLGELIDHGCDAVSLGEASVSLGVSVHSHISSFVPVDLSYLQLRLVDAIWRVILRSFLLIVL